MSRGATPHWVLGGSCRLDLDRVRLMGVLNVTPDSFHDGGRHPTTASAVDQALELVARGADLIDVGGESTRPGAERLDPAEQIRRTRDVVADLRRRSEVAISIDTTRAEVAEAALDAGANVVNDVSAGMEDPGLLDLVATRRCGLVLMHRVCPPERDSWSDQYPAEPDFGSEGVLESVCGHLEERVAQAVLAGIDPAQIVVDPGLGFGKSVRQNLQLLEGLPRLLRDGRPILIGASRKSFIGAVTESGGPETRLPGSLAAAVLAAERGARIIRCHDVRETREAILFREAVNAAGSGG